MTRLTDSFHVVDGVAFEYSAGVKSAFNVTVVIGKSGLSLIDTGMPGSSRQIEEYLLKIGHDISELKQIVLTHLDNDHIGSAPELKKETGAKVILHQLDAILSTDKSIRIDDLKRMFPDYGSDELGRLMEKISGIRDLDLTIDRQLDSKETRITIDDKYISIIHTPGHTPGHCCVYSQEDSVLVSGDSLSIKNATVQDPVPMYTVSLPRARESLKNLGKLNFDRLVSYHDEPLLTSSSTKLKEYLQRI